MAYELVNIDGARRVCTLSRAQLLQLNQLLVTILLRCRYVAFAGCHARVSRAAVSAAFFPFAVCPSCAPLYRDSVQFIRENNAAPALLPPRFRPTSTGRPAPSTLLLTSSGGRARRLGRRRPTRASTFTTCHRRRHKKGRRTAGGSRQRRSRRRTTRRRSRRRGGDLSRSDAAALLGFEPVEALTPNAVNKRFRELAKEKHPDKQRDQPDAGAEMAKLIQARNVLLSQREREPEPESEPESEPEPESDPYMRLVSTTQIEYLCGAHHINMTTDVQHFFARMAAIAVHNFDKGDRAFEVLLPKK